MLFKKYTYHGKPKGYVTSCTCMDFKRTEYKCMLNFVSHILCYVLYTRSFLKRAPYIIIYLARNAERRGEAYWSQSYFLNHSFNFSGSFSVSGLRCRIPDSGFVLFHTPDFMNGFLISKETAVLRRWERLKQQFGFIKRVDKGWISTVKGLESWCFER